MWHLREVIGYAQIGERVACTNTISKPAIRLLMRRHVMEYVETRLRVAIGRHFCHAAIFNKLDGSKTVLSVTKIPCPDDHVAALRAKQAHEKHRDQFHQQDPVRRLSRSSNRGNW